MFEMDCSISPSTIFQDTEARIRYYEITCFLLFRYRHNGIVSPRRRLNESYDAIATVGVESRADDTR